MDDERERPQACVTEPPCATSDRSDMPGTAARERLATRRDARVLLASAAPLALAACGGEGGSTAPATGSAIVPTPPAPPPPPPITGQSAGRFLIQSAMGSNKADIDRVVSLGYPAWIEEQFNMPRPTTHWDWMVANGYTASGVVNGQGGFNATMWRQLISSPDQLRQRVAMALLDFLVVGIDGVSFSARQFAVAAYVDSLADNAFGNYRAVLEAITYTPAMGNFLTYLGNRKANPATGSQPDENYAREIMQLFTIGLVRLNQDGTPQGGTAAPETYTLEDVSGLARVFTGFTLDPAVPAVPDRFRLPMVIQASNHETGVKSFLGTTIAPGTDGPSSVKQALDTLFAHPNVPPFVSKQLIQRLVTSNPSPAYVGRVAARFADNGQGVRGDMKAVIRAILLDTEARDASTASGAQFGRLRAPVNRLTAWARGFGVTSPTETWPFGDTSNTANRLAQSPGRAPSVFNFFRPGYTPPNTQISAAGLVAPEFQITTEPSVIAYVNYMQVLIQNGAGEAKADYSALIALASDAAALVAEVNLILGSQISAATLSAIQAAVESIAATGTNGPANRVYAAITLTMASTEFITQR